jgi:hypothetical protein
VNTQSYPAYRWFVLVSLVVVTTAGAMTMIAPAPLVGEIAKDLGVGPDQPGNPAPGTCRRGATILERVSA